MTNGYGELWYSSLINDGVPFIIDVLGFILNAPSCKLFSTVWLTVPGTMETNVL